MELDCSRLGFSISMFKTYITHKLEVLVSNDKELTIVDVDGLRDGDSVGWRIDGVWAGGVGRCGEVGVDVRWVPALNFRVESWRDRVGLSSGIRNRG